MLWSPMLLWEQAVYFSGLNLHCEPKKKKKNVPLTFEALNIMSQTFACIFKLILNFLLKFNVNQKWIQKLWTFWSIEGLKMQVGDFRNYNNFIPFNSFILLITSITIKIMSQCHQIRCSIWPPPFSATSSDCIHQWLIKLLMNFFCEFIPCIFISL